MKSWGGNWVQMIHLQQRRLGCVMSPRNCQWRRMSWTVCAESEEGGCGGEGVRQSWSGEVGECEVSVFIQGCRM